MLLLAKRCLERQADQAAGGEEKVVWRQVFVAGDFCTDVDAVISVPEFFPLLQLGICSPSAARSARTLPPFG